jgi:hypothetical protein
MSSEPDDFGIPENLIIPNLGLGIFFARKKRETVADADARLMNRLIISLLQAPVACILSISSSLISIRRSCRRFLSWLSIPQLDLKISSRLSFQQVDCKRAITRSGIYIRADARFMFSRIKFLT